MRRSRFLSSCIALTLLALLTSELPAAEDADVKQRTFDLTVVGPDQNPVAGATVEIRTTPVVTAQQIQRGTFVRGLTYAAIVTANANGQLTFQLPAATKSLTLNITTPGYGPYWANWSSHDHPQPIPDKFTAELDAGWSVGGIVVDDNERPLKGAKVHPSIVFKKRPGDEQELHLGGNFETDADGRWRFDSVPASQNQVSVRITHPQFAPLSQRLARSQFEIKPGEHPSEKTALKPGLVVSGTVADDQARPIAGALVRAKFLNELREAATNDAGLYKLVGCEPGTAKIVVSAKGRAIDMREVRIEPDLEPLDFQLQPGGHVRIRVLDEKGNGLPKARIFFQGWRGRYEYFEFNVNQYADNSGVWEWNEAPVDGFLADICRPGGMQLGRQFIIARDEEYVFRPPPALVITGNVVDADTKEPIKAFRVVPGVRGSPTEMNWVPQDTFDAADGRFSTQKMHDNFAWLIRIEASGYFPAVSRDIKSDEGNVTLNFALKKGKDVAARLLTPDGKHAAKAQIALGVAGSQISIKNGQFDGETYATRVDADDAGQFRIPPPGSPFQLVILHPTGYAHIKSTGELPPDSIPLTAWAKVEGTFRIGKRAVAGVPIDVSVDQLHSYGKDAPHIYAGHQATTGADGRFVFDRVVAGRGWIARELDDGALEPISSVRYMADFAAGETTHLDLGGSGVTVTGKLQPPDGFKDPPRWNFALLTARLDLPQELRASSPYVMATIGRDGAFRIDDMPAGDYLLNLRFARDPVGSLSNHRLLIPPADPTNPNRPHDLGSIRLDP